MSLRRFENQVVFVTGGTSGLGADTCELFIQEGARVFVTDIAERDILQRLGSSSAVFQLCDVSNPEDCEKAINACVERFGRLDVLFHNGARLAGVSTVVDHDVTLFQQVINTNLCGLFYLARVAIPQMQKQGKGAIVSTASTSGLAGDYGLCSYSAAKAGLVNLTRVMALDHAREGIRVNCVCPGYMVTPMTAAFRENEVVHQALLESIPLHRGSDPKEVSRAVLFLASSDASYITGQALIADGGWSAHSGGPNFLKYMGPQRWDKVEMDRLLCYYTVE
ncbi:uncharacterized protein A1O5_06783 [Cladophialophora psammophila CBS 110553]|uniref:Glucose 1-dehydrogenase n=1 Tax=Cladophialophora psammophila CBS 110553 TaxID=1182543 RepID=W9WND1_9EURO|nr:uncharacterized protein A1O5_06783 [Cladophialophora psammophila CBS 110553]EXJ69712.1 hypothetical protein A1O5_06783 [Cladophialophora psammophila CBS 110553]